MTENNEDQVAPKKRGRKSNAQKKIEQEQLESASTPETEIPTEDDALAEAGSDQLENASESERIDAVEESLNEVMLGQEETSSKLDKLTEMMANFATPAVAPSTDALHTPVSITKDALTNDQLDERTNMQDIEFQDVEPEDDAQLVERSHMNIDTPEFKEKAEMMRFMNQRIKILVYPSQEQYADKTLTVGVNGRTLAILRGTPAILPRCYVEVLARAKVSRYQNIEQRNAQTNEREVVHPETRSPRNIFQVLEDRHPLGPKWLTRITNER